MQKLNIILFGAPGAGKGTQAVKLAETFHLIHLSTGDILRAEIAADTDLGKQAKAIIDKGELMPDSIICDIIRNKIQANPNAVGFIFDGFPRTVPQAVALDGMLEKMDMHIRGVLCLDVPKEELVQRLLLRGKDSGRADDQSIDVIENRIAVYNEKTFPLIDYYQKQNKQHSVNGTGSIEDIALRLKETVDQIRYIR